MIENIAKKYVDERFPAASVREKEKIVNDWKNKVDSSRKLVEDFEYRVGSLMGRKILDAGSGNGGVSIAFAEKGASVYGIDIEEELYQISKKHAEEYGVSIDFTLYNGEKLPYQDNFFDYAVSVSVLEHTSDPINYLKEILRVVKEEGSCYLAFPNKLCLKETHTQVWFLTYLPSFFRSSVLNLFKRNPLEANNLHFYTYFDLLRFISNTEDKGYRWSIKFEEGRAFGFKKVLKNILRALGIPYKMFLSHISVILRKEKIK